MSADLSSVIAAATYREFQRLTEPADRDRGAAPLPRRPDPPAPVAAPRLPRLIKRLRADGSASVCR